MKKILFILFYLSSVLTVYTQSISVTGIWNYTVPQSAAIEAGEDITDEFFSSVNQIYIAVNSTEKWKVKVQRFDIDWHEKFKLRVRRTGDGLLSSGAEIDGGEGWVEIKDGDDNDFFKGKYSILSIPCQYFIENVSVLIPQHTYSTEVMFTIFKD